MSLANNDVITKLNEIQSLINSVVNSNSNTPYCDFVKSTINRVVCDVFIISEDELFRGTSKGHRTDAAAVACVAYRYYLNYSHTKLKDLFHKQGRNSITFYINRLKSLNPKVPQDKKLIEKIRIIKTTLETTIKTQ